MLFHVSCFIQSSYIESQVVGPLANDTVSRMAVIGHLKLEDVVATRSVSVLIEQDTGTCTSCWTEREEERNRDRQDEGQTDRQRVCFYFLTVDVDGSDVSFFSHR